MSRRTGEVTINDKKFTVTELRITDCVAISKDIKAAIKKAKDIRGIVKVVTDEKFVNSMVEKHLKKFVPEATKEDILNAYPSELADAVEVIKDVNFTTFKNIISKITSIFTEEKIEDIIKKLFKEFYKYISDQIPTENSVDLDTIEEKLKDSD